MLCSVLPGGVVAGVVGIERVLLRLVSIDMGFCCPLLIAWWGGHVKLSELPMLTALEALVGGVGKVWARSRLGRPIFPDKD